MTSAERYIEKHGNGTTEMIRLQSLGEATIEDCDLYGEEDNPCKGRIVTFSDGSTIHVVPPKINCFLGLNSWFEESEENPDG